LTSEQAALLKSIYQRIGMVLIDLTRYLKNNRKDDYHAFIETSTVLLYSCNRLTGRPCLHGYIHRGWRL